MQAHLLYEYGKVGNSSKNITISYGTRRHSNHPKRVHTSQIRRCQGRTGADESKGAVKKEMALVDMENAKRELKRVSAV